MGLKLLFFYKNGMNELTSKEYKRFMDTDTLESNIAKKMLKNAQFERTLEISLLSISPDSACMQMQVTKKMLNGHGTCHGGAIFSLADAAFALACNAKNIITVAQACDISFVRPANSGDTLTAKAREKYLKGRNGIYDVEIVNQHNEQVAFFTGKSCALKGHVISSDE